MEEWMRAPISALILALLGSSAADSQIARFEHIVVIFQENRTPDNLFQGLCGEPYGTSDSCSIKPSANSPRYNIQTDNWLDKASPTGATAPGLVALANKYDLSHAHSAFVKMCDAGNAGNSCQMDGAGAIACSGNCPPKPQFRFVDNSSGILNPYLDLGGLSPALHVCISQQPRRRHIVACPSPTPQPLASSAVFLD
jgi:hypothetical protein